MFLKDLDQVRTTGVSYSSHLCHEQRKANPDGCQVCRAVLLGRQHEDREHQLEGKEGFDEQAAHNGGSWCESRGGEERLDQQSVIVCVWKAWRSVRGYTYTRKQTRHDTRGSHRAQDLRYEDDRGARIGQTADQHEAAGHSWVEHSTADAEEDPGVDCEAESEGERNVE